MNRTKTKSSTQRRHQAPGEESPQDPSMVPLADSVGVALAPFIRAQASGRSWIDPGRAGGGNAHARLKASDGSVSSRAPGSEVFPSAVASRSAAPLSSRVRWYEKTTSPKDAWDRKMSPRRYGAATDLFRETSRGEGNPACGDAAEVLADAIRADARRHQRIMRETLFSRRWRKHRRRLIGVALSWRWGEGPIC